MKKCLVLDLDNTLWGGVVGEDGIEGIKLSLDPPGSSFMAFQQAILDRHDRGVILAINSRNNPDDAWEVIRKHPNMILKEDHFAATRMNWDDKAENIRELAKELNIGLDSMVFLDDDPTNRELVRALIPEVETPDLPADPADYAKFLNSSDYFDSSSITDEDKMRGNFYVTERLRKEAEKSHADKKDFLESLSLELQVSEDDDSCLSRLAQLTGKTNQFNIDKQPFTEEQIRAFIDSGKHKIFHGRLQDKFGDYGIIAFAVVDTEKDRWHLSALLMSCRVFGRGVEDAFLGVIARRAFEGKAGKITIALNPTVKNEPVRRFIDRHFDKLERQTAKLLEAPPWIKLAFKDHG